MPITSDLGGKNYTLGRGRLFFDRFSAAQISAGITASSARYSSIGREWLKSCIAMT